MTINLVLREKNNLYSHKYRKIMKKLFDRVQTTWNIFYEGVLWFIGCF